MKSLIQRLGHQEVLGFLAAVGRLTKCRCHKMCEATFLNSLGQRQSLAGGLARSSALGLTSLQLVGQLSRGDNRRRTGICSSRATCYTTLASNRQGDAERNHLPICSYSPVWLCGGGEGTSQPRRQTELQLQPFLPSSCCVLEKLRSSPYRSACGAGGSVWAAEPAVLQEGGLAAKELLSSVTRKRQNRLSLIPVSWADRFSLPSI